jgi:divalent metal cation (Fe/Co/Zn/Cd) transporter
VSAAAWASNEGVTHLQHPQPLEDPFWAYVVLGIAGLFEAVSWVLAFRALWKQRRGRTLWRTVRDSRDPSVFTVVFEDSAALLGLLAAFLGVWLGHRLANPYFGGGASIVIGGILCVTALVLIRESKALLIGEAAAPATVSSIRTLAGADHRVDAVQRVSTMVLA